MNDDILKMAREADREWDCDRDMVEWLECFADLVRAAEQDRCCRIIFGMAGSDNVAQRTVDAIRGKAHRATLTKPCGSLGEDIDNPSF